MINKLQFIMLQSDIFYCPRKEQQNTGGAYIET
jgi:hypothetical protein